MGSDIVFANKLKPYIQAMPDLFNYEIVSKVLLGILLYLLGQISQALLESSGRVAVTSGDYQFLFGTWQGLLILVVGIVSLFIYVAIDLNATIALCGDLVIGKEVSVTRSIKEGFVSIRKLISLQGILVVLYIALIAPILGIGLSVSATRGFYIPNFISAFIKDSVLYSALAGVVALLFLFIGIANLFLLHGIVIDGLSAGSASDQSRRLIRDNWKDYLKQNVLCFVTITALLAGVAILFLFLPLKLITLLPAGVISRILTIFFVSAGAIISMLTGLLGIPLYLMKMTQLFYSYKQGEEYPYHEVEKAELFKSRKVTIGTLIAIAAAVLLMFGYFDQLFPQGTSVNVIAHRGGGNEASENTLAGLESAWNNGAYGSEIDIQRTKDGHYVVNHDGTFRRVAGDDRKPEEMTLKEVKKLTIDGEPVATLPEMLITSKGRLVLFIELKGKTADKKMAEDTVKLVKQFQMEEECVLISLKYDLINYIESTYPEIQTGFLTFASYGETAQLNCDYIGLEEESATADAISAIHKEGKKALVWTVNEKGAQKHFLCTKADGIITDHVKQATELSSKLDQRSDLDRMVDKVKTIL